MLVVLASLSETKKKSVEIALNTLGIFEFEIVTIEVDSKVGPKPLNHDVILGSNNRAKCALDYCNKNNIPYDLIIGLEGGYEEVDDNYFVTSYATILDKTNKKFVGKSVSLQISKFMYEWTKKGYSLNEVINGLVDPCDNKKGLSSYLSNGYYKRDFFESSAVISALSSAINYQGSYSLLDNCLEEKLALLDNVG